MVASKGLQHLRCRPEFGDRSLSLTRLVQGESGDGHPEAQPVAVEKRIERAEERSPARPARHLSKRIAEAEAVASRVEGSFQRSTLGGRQQVRHLVPDLRMVG